MSANVLRSIFVIIIFCLAGVSGAHAAGKTEINANTIKDPVIGFIFSNKGLMYNLTFEGSKITKLDK